MTFPLINFWYQDFEDRFAVTSLDLGPFPFAGGNVSTASRVGQCHRLQLLLCPRSDRMRGGKGGFPKGFSQNISIWILFF